MKLYSLAKAIIPFVESSQPELIYKTIFSNKNLYFITQMVKAKDIPTLVFFVSELYKKNDNKEEFSKISNNVFTFNVLKFGTRDDVYSCSYCDGEGSFDCGDCGGVGQIRCSECYQGVVDCGTCDGDGKDICEACDGSGKDEEGETCLECGGEREVTCSECDGTGEVECPECSGDGTVECKECSWGKIDCDGCDGRGEEEYPDAIQVEIYIYASYDTVLKNTIEMSILRNTNELDFDLDNDKVLLLQVANVTPQKSSDPFNVDTKYEDEEYFGEIRNNEDVDLQYKVKNKLISLNLSEIPDIFLK